MSTQNLTQSPQNSNTPILTPELVAKISARFGLEPRFIELWAYHLITGSATDQDGQRLIGIMFNILAGEEGAK